jgi:HPt (histidine-containing phosphotransfer) domain-containing protein
VTAFDPALAEEAIEDDVEGLASFIHSVLSSLEAGVNRVRDAIATGDAGTVRAAAHAVKGSSSHLGASEVGKHAGTIEDAAREGRIERQETVDALAQAVAALQRTVEDYLKRRSAGA